MILPLLKILLMNTRIVSEAIKISVSQLYLDPKISPWFHPVLQTMPLGSGSNQLYISSLHTTHERRRFSKPDWEVHQRIQRHCLGTACLFPWFWEMAFPKCGQTHSNTPWRQKS